MSSADDRPRPREKEGMRYAIKDGEVIEVEYCHRFGIGNGGCPYCPYGQTVGRSSYDVLMEYQQVQEGIKLENPQCIWPCAILNRDTGPSSDFPDWCPLPSEEPGSGDIELLDQHIAQTTAAHDEKRTI